jgi:Flp pilus assembly protein TadD
MKKRCGTDRGRMLREADLGFRQALALCPYSPEVIWHYDALLVSQGRTEEARLVRRMAQELAPLDPQLREWLDLWKPVEEEQGG